jgi:hypothetical protein
VVVLRVEVMDLVELAVVELAVELEMQEQLTVVVAVVAVVEEFLLVELEDQEL